MAVTTTLIGRDTTGGALATAAVRPSGSLAVAPPVDDESATIVMGTDDIPVTAIKPRAGLEILVTGVILTTSRDVGTNGATVDIYHAAVEGSTDTSEMVLQLVDVAKNTAVPVTAMRRRVPVGRFVLGKTNDDDCTATLLYHYEAV